MHPDPVGYTLYYSLQLAVFYPFNYYGNSSTCQEFRYPIKVVCPCILAKPICKYRLLHQIQLDTKGKADISRYSSVNLLTRVE